MSKKAKIIKIIALCIQIIPLLLVVGINAPVLVSRWDKALSSSAILVLILLAVIFRDASRRILAKPSGFFISAIVFGLCMMNISIGEELMTVSATSLISSLIAMPLNTWYNYLTRPLSTEEFKKVVIENEKDKS